MSESGLLSDLTVVEMSVHRAGPFCGALLADLGADVIKVERPDIGDPARRQGPGAAERSGYFMANNRNKKSVELDLKSAAGKDAMYELVADADVFIENFAYGVSESLGVSYEDLTAHNPDLVYASIKGYGETGPAKEKKGLDLILQAEGGLMSVTGPEGGAPVKVGQAIGDLTTGLFATVGILARLHEREQGDGGGSFDVGLFDAVVSIMNEYLTLYSLTGEIPAPQGTSHQTMVPYQLFETADGHVVTGVPSDDRWAEFVDVIGCDSVSHYERNEQRVEYREEVIGAIQNRMAEATTEEWLSALAEAGFPVGPLNDVSDVVDHEQTEARNLAPRLEDPDAGRIVLPGHPIHFPDHSTEIRSSAPQLGEHTVEVFSTVAEDQRTLDEWQDQGAFD